jgi:hypothetical protein
MELESVPIVHWLREIIGLDFALGFQHWLLMFCAE